MKDMTVETLNFIILCMGLLFVMAGIFLIVGKLAGKRPASLRPGEHFYQLVVPCAGMALIIAGPNGWACFGTRILIAAALQ